jgi:hypothetical protein
MPKGNKRQPAKKRTYARRAIKSNVIDPPNTTIKKDTEIEELTTICSIMDNFTSEQKQRVLKFLCGRYYDFL